MPSLEEERSPRGTSKKGTSGSLEEMVAQVVDGSKKRSVGRAFDPEFSEGNRMPFIVKTGGVGWGEGIGGGEVALREAGVGFCDGMRWLVGEEELKKRRERGGLASTVVVKIMGLEPVGWWREKGVMERVKEKVDGLKKGLEKWRKKKGEEEEKESDRVEKVLAVLKGLNDRLSVVEGSVKSMVREVGKVGLSMEEELREKKEEYLRRMKLREEEHMMEQEMDNATDEFFKASGEEIKQGMVAGGGVHFSVRLEGSSGFSFGKSSGDTSFGDRGGNLFNV
ncbi:hypothetical protein HOY80DRAFT_1039266 [Tuber brumale]|nr:hypothetical protein HOY80DRAFT_1039266 [Tuber brumale]